MDFDLHGYLEARKALVDERLERLVPPAHPDVLFEAMRYSLLAGGKRLRPILCLAACELVGSRVEAALDAACAIEMVHTMSLIHDDLPAMDDDDLRRGRPTCHRRFGEDIAILAGDGLLVLAFETLARPGPGVEAARALRAVAEPARAAGPAGMVAGQVVDLRSAGRDDVPVQVLDWIHRNKTARLMEASVVIGSILGGADEPSVASLRIYGAETGLAFQIADDILDVTSTLEALGKRPGRDDRARKVTYPRLLGLEESIQAAHAHVAQAIAALRPFGPAADSLRALAEFAIARTC